MAQKLPSAHSLTFWESVPEGGNAWPETPHVAPRAKGRGFWLQEQSGVGVGMRLPLGRRGAWLPNPTVRQESEQGLGKVAALGV